MLFDAFLRRMSSDVIAAFLMSAFLSLNETNQHTLVKSTIDFTYLATLKSISITKSIDALFTFAKARALTMQERSFRLHSGSLVRIFTRVYSP